MAMSEGEKIIWHSSLEALKEPPFIKDGTTLREQAQGQREEENRLERIAAMEQQMAFRSLVPVPEKVTNAEEMISAIENAHDNGSITPEVYDRSSDTVAEEICRLDQDFQAFLFERMPVKRIPETGQLFMEVRFPKSEEASEARSA